MAEPKSKDEVIDLIAESFSPAPKTIVRQMFNAVGARAPEVIWSPSEAELRNPLLRQFSVTCGLLSDDEGRLQSDKVDLDHFGELKDWIMMIEPVKGENDFRYTYYGEAIAQHYGKDMTGCLTSEIEGHVGTFFMGLYRAMTNRSEPVYSAHEPPQHVFVRAWQRYIIPVFAQTGEISSFLAINVPENELRAGLELMTDPVMVLTDDQDIVYANRAAQTMFKLPKLLTNEKFEPATGIPLNTHYSPVDLLTKNHVEDSVQLTIKGSIVERLVMTVSAAQYKNLAYYVVVMRLIGT